LQAFSTCDVVMLGYHAAMAALLAAATTGPARERSFGIVVASALGLVIGCVAGRTSTRLSARARTFIYRSVLTGSIVGSYLMLRDILPIVQPRSLDAQLLAFDVAVFGGEPVLWLARFTTPAVVEYFAFFYFSYFGLLAAYGAAVMAFDAAGDAIAEFTIGAALVFCVGQLGYVLVPGYGPVHFFAGQLEPLEGGFFWRAVLLTVESASAMKDIFPSLHTAAPTFFAIFAVRRAVATRGAGWIAASVFTAAFALNIVASTVVLRWHYAADVLAGLALAVGASAAAPRLARWERALRARHGMPSAW
jgi:hypothetical protein